MRMLGVRLWALLGLIAAVAGLWLRSLLRAARFERMKIDNKDHENAEDIRDRVSRDLSDRVRKYDDAGWRD